MILKESFFQLDIKAHDSMAVILDASESADKHWEEIKTLAASLTDKLPADTDIKLYFLSSPRLYDLNHLACQSKEWKAQNRSKGSFITPVMKNIDQNTGKIIVIGSGPVYDLEDWIDTDFSGKFIFVKMEESLKGDLTIGIEIGPSDLFSHLHDPIQSVEISGRGFMPFYWDNSGYETILGDETVIGANQLKDFSISFACYGEEVTARVKRTGSERQFTPEQLETNPEEKEEWNILSEAEADVFKQALAGSRFVCPQCKKEHPANTLKCYEGSSILGKPVYPSLGNRKGFFVFLKSENNFRFRHHPVNIIKVGDAQAAIHFGNKTTLYAFDKGKWTAKEELHPYYRIKKNQYLLAV